MAYNGIHSMNELSEILKNVPTYVAVFTLVTDYQSEDRSIGLVSGQEVYLADDYNTFVTHIGAHIHVPSDYVKFVEYRRVPWSGKVV